MKKKALLKGMLALVLVFGMTVVGCDNGTTDDSTGTQNPDDNNPGGDVITIPNAPTGVSALAISSSSIQVSWNTVPGATNYSIVYYTSSNSGSLDATSSPAIVIGLNASTTYSIYVLAGNSIGWSSAFDSSIVTATTNAPTIPSTPTGLSARALGSTSIELSWHPVSGATSYNIYSPPTAGSQTGFALIGTVTTNTYIDPWVSANQTWYYRVSAVNIAGESPQSSSVSARTYNPLPGPTNITAAHADYASRLNTSRNSILITWNAVSGAVSYNVYYWVTFLGGYWEKASFSPVVGTSFNHTGLSPATSYYYTVRAVDSGGGEGSNGTPDGGTSIGRTAP